MNGQCIFPRNDNYLGDTVDEDEFEAVAHLSLMVVAV